MNHEPQTYVDLQDAGNAQSQLILQAIARHADWDTGDAFPAVATIARMAKCSDKTVRRHLKKLELDCFITMAPREREDGSQGANLITLVGYADWIKANRKGGTVMRPRRARRYKDDEITGAADGVAEPETQQNGPGQVDQGAGHNDQGANPGEPNEMALVTLTREPDRMTGGPGHLVSNPKNTSLEQVRKDSPPTPRGSRRRGREGEVDDLILKITTPERERAIRILFEPLVRRLKIEAPDPAFALRQLADWAAKLPDDVLAEARQWLFERRKLSAKAADIEEAVKVAKANAEAAAKLAGCAYLFAGSPQWTRALQQLERINPVEAGWLRCQTKVRRADLEKLGVQL